MSDQKKLPALVDPDPNSLQHAARESWRVFAIMAEFVEATERLSRIGPAVSIFGSARTAPGHPYYALAEDIARRLSDAGFSVISGGGPGVMEAANKGGQAGSAPTVGLNIQLPHEQNNNPYQDISQSFKHFFARKYFFVRFAHAYVVMPGGYGTVDELMEVLTLIQTGKTRRIPVILVHAPFWRDLIGWFRNTLVPEGMINAEDLDLFQVIDEPQAVVDAIFKHYETRGFEPSQAEREAQLRL